MIACDASFRLVTSYPVFAHTYNLTQKVGKLGLTYFGIIQSAFLIGYGAKEVFLDGECATPRDNSCWIRQRLSQVCSAIFDKLSENDRGSVNYPRMHGTLFFTSGVYGTISALASQRYINVNNYLPAVNFCADALFVGANVIAIKHNIDLYTKAKNNLNRQEQSFSLQVMQSAALGILSSLCYILAGIIPILGVTTSYALVFGCIAITTGGLKIIYDFFLLNHQLKI